MENHNVSTNKILLETLDIDKDIGIENKDSAPITPCNNQVSLETELTALKLFVLE